MEILEFAGWLLGFFVLTELAAYLLHRFLFHGPLWAIHRTHHEPNNGVFELNDLFSAFFALSAMGLMFLGREHPLQSIAFAAGTGISLYGMIYFVVHDVFTHGRFFRLSLKNRFVRRVRNAHRTHHQDTGRHGLEPFGLLLFIYSRYRVRT